MLVQPTYLVLGSIEVDHERAERFRLAPGRQEIVLTTLLLEANRVVSTDRLIEAIWGDSPPVTARAQVQICVSALRNNLAEIDRAGALVTRPPGYLLQVRDGHLDSRVFLQLVGDADALANQNRLEEAEETLTRAIGLWRGPALSGIKSLLLRAKAAHLDESLLAAKEARIDLLLKLGRYHGTIGEISSLLEENPLRERVRGQLMLALYRSGRRAEALECYRVGRELMIDELGIEPNAELRELERAILTGDSSLDRCGGAAEVVETRTAAAPRQLPADIADFTGRTELTGRITDLLTDSRAGRIVVLTGKPGVGKSTLAVHVARLIGEVHFPDGELYFELGGTRATPEDPADVLGRVLRALNTPYEAIPDTLDERAAMYRHLMAKRRMLIVLDDAASESQVRHLLPGNGDCAVIVTSRVRHTGLPGARVFEVDAFEPDEATDMLVNVVGRHRVLHEPAAAKALIRLVGGLPLALRIVSARISARPRLTLSWMLRRLSDERRRLDELAHGEMVVRASIAPSYDSLPADARRLLRLLSTLDGPCFPSWVAAALLDDPAGADLLELLVDAQMIEVVADDGEVSPRYYFHELIRLFARDRLSACELPQDVAAAHQRVAAGWLGLAREAHGRIYGRDGSTVLHGSASRWTPPRDQLESILADPLAWLEEERANLVAAVESTARVGLDEHCWDLAVTLVALFEVRCYLQDWENTHAAALVAVRRADNVRGEAALLCSLGSLHLTRCRTVEAQDALMLAFSLFTALGDTHGLAISRRNLAMVDQLGGDWYRALHGYRQAAAEFAAVGDDLGQADVWNQIATIKLDLDDVESAERRLRHALVLCPPTGNRRVETQVRHSLSEVLLRRGQLHEANELLMELLAVVRTGRDLVGQVRVLERLGAVNARLGHHYAAERLLREARDLKELTTKVIGPSEVIGPSDLRVGTDPLAHDQDEAVPCS
ncbi:SARP family transcriptional regulator [Saccharothrix sp. ALI-22-I]|nr:SARP family transcriptional regulator [Saccharothrix sp. ALI-22-I]